MAVRLPDWRVDHEKPAEHERSLSSEQPAGGAASETAAPCLFNGADASLLPGFVALGLLYISPPTGSAVSGGGAEVQEFSRSQLWIHEELLRRCFRACHRRRRRHLGCWRLSRRSRAARGDTVARG